MASEGRKILSIFLILASGLFFIGLFVKLPIFPILGGVFSLLLLFSLNFFREPVRKIPDEKNIIVSPADGKITEIKKVNDPEVGKDSTLISIFLNVFDVHSNRVPLDGKVISVKRKSGQFLAAYKHEAVDVNEQVATVLSTSLGAVKIKQIAGILARRILCYAKKDDLLKQGEKFGFIMFGSRTDVILPPSINVIVKVGQRVKGTETIIGKY